MQSSNEQPIKDLARGKWAHILSSFGISEEHLRNKHTSCPLCGGKDRYRFDNKGGDGRYFCNQCGPGDGITLLQGFKGWGFPTAVRELKNFLGGYSAPISQAKRQNKPDPYKAIEKILSEAKPIQEGDQVTQYLRNRGLSRFPESLLFHGKLYDVDSKANYQGMLGIMEDSKGKIVSIHRTFLQDGSKASITAPKKIMSPIGTINGSSVRLFPLESHIGIAEGIETALAAYELFNIPTWATVSTNGMKTFIPPDGIEEITIFGDNDKNFAGQAAAYEAANKLHLKGYRVNVKLPLATGKDWLDLMQP